MATPLHLNPDLRHDFVFVFDVTDGNPNGDPDAGNMPRIDPETGQGLVTDVCLKRKIRNYVALKTEGDETNRYGIFVQERGILNREIASAYKDLGYNLEKDATTADGKKRKESNKGEGSEVDKARKQMCDTRFDIRLFGAVMSTGANAGQVRGPLQLTFGRSVDPIASMEVAITRMAVATEKESEAQSGENRTIGRKAILPYGLYVAKGFYSPAFAKKTGVTTDDLALVWDALENMFDVDRSAARGIMTCRGLYVFTHHDERGLGNAPAHKLFAPFEATTPTSGDGIRKRPEVESPRRFADYIVPVPTVPEAYAGKVTLTALVTG